MSLPNRTEPLPGITSAGQPDEAALARLAEDGYVAVIDLRGPDEPRGFDEPAVVKGLGMQYLSLPVTSGDDLSYEMAGKLDEALSGLNGPALVHCAAGGRVGALLALRQRLNGEPADQAFATGLAGGLGGPALIQIVQRRLSER